MSPLFTREPGSTWIGEQVRRAIAERIDPVAEALLFAADHAAHLSTVIRPALREGRLVISDRFADSRYAYQAVTLEGILTDPLDWIAAVHSGWSIRPDRTFLLVLPVEEAVKRLSGNSLEHFERADVLEKVQVQYLGLVDADPERFILIDALKNKKEISGFVAGEIRNCVALSRSRRPRA